MAQRIQLYQNFSGGWSIDPKLGQKNSFAYSQGWDFRKSPSQMSVLPGLAREDNNAVSDLVQNEVMLSDGTIYAIGDQGNVYRRTTAATWSKEGNIGTTGTFGIDYRKDTDDIYIAGTKSVSRYQSVSTAPSLIPNYYGSSYSTYNNTSTVGFNVAAYQSDSTNSYQPKTAIYEAPTDLRYFQSDIEPLNQISIYITNKGTGDWTLTLHDGINRVLATSTITNANLVNNSWNNFVFSNATNGQVRIYIAPNARTYHVHVTSTVADGQLSCSTASNLSSCDLQVWADRMVQTINGIHPIDRFQQWEIIGNGNYVSVWEPITDPPTNTEWQRHKLVFPMQYECCGIDHTNEYSVMAFEQSVSNTSMTKQSGLIAFWDGDSSTYNYYVIIPEGSPYGLHTYKNIVYYYAGGDWYELTSPTTLPVKIRSLPGSATEFSGTNSPIKVYPYAATVRRGIQLMAYPSATVNTNVNFGVYSWGALDQNFPNSFGYSYVISTGSKNYSVSNNLRIGMVKNFGDILQVSWQDSLNGNYGVDSVTNATNPVSTAIWQGLVFDNGYAGKPKLGIFVECYYNLPAGATLQLGYSINRGAFVTDSNLYSTTNLWQGRTGYCRFNITSGNQGRFYEIQPQVIVQSNGSTTSAIVYMVGIVWDDLREESRA